MNSFRLLSIRKLIIGAMLLMGPLTASAYVEDLCLAQGGGWQNCNMDPCEPGNENALCGAGALITNFGPQSGHGVGVRSSLHFDSTYFLAQAAGFTARDAYYTAAYDAATDDGQYIHRDQQANLAIDPSSCSNSATDPACQLNSAVIDGPTRNNFVEGGIFFHFMVGTAPADTQIGLHPDPTNAQQQPFLYALRRWVYGQGPLCVAGLVSANGQSCFVSSTRNTSSLVGRMPLLGNTGIVTSIDWVSTIGEQLVSTNPDGSGDEPASNLGKHVPAQDLPLAKLGIFLHAIADRVSHHRCIDVSAVNGPRSATAGPILLNPLTLKTYQSLINIQSILNYILPLLSTPLIADPDFIYTYDTNQCDQLHHFLRHTYETAHDQSTLALEDQTSKYGLLAVFDELIKFAKANNFPGAHDYSPAQREAIVGNLLVAIAQPDGQARVDALTTLAPTQGWLPLPLYGGQTLSQWQAKAGKAQFATASQTSTSGGGALNPILLLVFALAALIRRRQ